MQCLTKDCPYKVYARGVCQSCRFRLGYRVRSGAVTWEELERIGAILPKRSRVEFDSTAAIDAIVKRAKELPNG